MFVPKHVVPKRKQLDRVKVNLAPSLIRMMTKVYFAQNHFHSYVSYIVSIGPDRNENRNSSYLFYYFQKKK